MADLYLKRKIDDFLIEWKNTPEHKPLIVKGPRQVGKTVSILRFAEANYENVIYINFVEEPKYKLITADGYRADDIIKNISRMDPSKRFEDGKTVLFFDELQDFPEISTALKFFHIDGRFDVICSGSLLGIHYKRIESNSVGYKTDYQMSSLDFEEFLWARGYDQEIVQEMLQHMETLTPFNEVEMKVYSGLFFDYIILGGMPAVVRQHIERGTFEGTLAIQQQLLEDYREDIRKYADGMDQTRILNVFEQIPVQLAKDNKKFQISKVASGARFKDYRGCIEWLRDAGIVLPCYCMNAPDLPIKGNYDQDKFKLYFFDTGLFVSMLDDEAQDDLRANKNLDVYKGALYENIVGEALVKSGYPLVYYKREDSTLEEDFFVRTRKHLLPVEVKATRGTAKSLRTLISSERYPDIQYGIKLTGGNVGFSDNIYTFPYFCAFLLKEYLQQSESIIKTTGETSKMDYSSITMEEAKNIFQHKGDYIILDVRRADEYASGHIPGAINVANEDIHDTDIPALPNKDQTIYVYCRSGRRSKEASSKLAAMEYSKIIEFGGILDWAGEIEI